MNCVRRLPVTFTSVLNLLLGRGYYDIALRGLGLSLGALALARLGTVFPPFRHSS